MLDEVTYRLNNPYTLIHADKYADHNILRLAVCMHVNVFPSARHTTKVSFLMAGQLMLNLSLLQSPSLTSFS